MEILQVILTGRQSSEIRKNQQQQQDKQKQLSLTSEHIHLTYLKDDQSGWMSGIFKERMQRFTAARCKQISIQCRQPTVNPKQTIADKVYTWPSHIP